MRPRWLHLLLFALLLFASIVALRLFLGTIAGLVLAISMLAVRILWTLYRWTEACTILLWSFTGELSERFAEARENRLVAKESRHATRLL
jgi:hypothetical protein